MLALNFAVHDRGSRRPPDKSRFSAAPSSYGIRGLQAVEKRGTTHVASSSFRVVCGPTQLGEICQAHRWVAFLHQTLVGDGLGLDVGDGGVPALAVVAVERFL